MTWDPKPNIPPDPHLSSSQICNENPVLHKSTRLLGQRYEHFTASTELTPAAPPTSWEEPFDQWSYECERHLWYFWIRTIAQSNGGVESKVLPEPLCSRWNVHGVVIRNKLRWFLVLCCCVFFLPKTTITVNSLLSTSYYSTIKSPLWENAVRALEVLDGLLGERHRCLRDRNRGIKCTNMSVIIYGC